MSTHDKYEHEIVHHEPVEGFDSTEPDAKRIWAFVLLSVTVLAVLIGATNMYFNQIWNQAVYEKVMSAPSGELQDARNLENWRLTHYEYADPSKTRVRIPFERAKELFLQEAAQGKLFYPAKPTEPKPETPPAPAGEPAAAGQPAPGQPAPATPTAAGQK